MNSLNVYDRPEFLNLKEFENVLIAPRINFIKLIKLPVSRMLGIKDKIINVPISLDTIKQTVKLLPRTFEEASVIRIMIKRKKEYISHVFHHYVQPAMIKKAILYLAGIYPFYEPMRFDLEKINNLEDLCNDEIEEELDQNINLKEPRDEISMEENEAAMEDIEERNYQENDAVK